MDIITPGTSTVDYIRDLDTERLQDFSVSQTQRRVNAFNMSWTTSPPNARFVLLCHIVTPPYLARRGLPHLMSWKNSSDCDKQVTRLYSPSAKVQRIFN